MFKRFWWVFLVMAVAMPILGLMISSVITYVMPKKFESTAIVYYHPIAEKTQDTNEAAAIQGLDDSDVKSCIEALGSDEVLLEVADNLELTNKWGYGRMEILHQLRNLIQTVRLRDSYMVQVRVRHTNKEDARDIVAELLRVSNNPIKMVIHEQPRIGQVPVSPNVRFNLLAGIIGGLFVSAFFSLPLIWLLDSSDRKKPAITV